MKHIINIDQKFNTECSDFKLNFLKFSSFRQNSAITKQCIIRVSAKFRHFQLKKIYGAEPKSVADASYLI